MFGDAFNALQGYQPTLPDAAPIVAALQQHMQAAPVQPPPAQRHGIGNVLGRIGDALLMAHGGEPIYANKIRNQQIGQEVSNYLGNTDAALASLFQQDPKSAIELYKMRHTETAAPTELQRDYEYLKQVNPALADQFIHMKTEGGPLIANNGDGTFTVIPRAMAQGGAPQAGAMPHVTDQASYDAVPAGAQYTTPDGHVRVKGGATASTPSPTFR